MAAEYTVLPEREVEAILRQEVKRHGGHAYKFVSPGTKGVPDRIVCLPRGRIYFVELKKHGEHTRPDQVVQIRKLRALGQAVYVVEGLLGLHALFSGFDWEDSRAKVEARLVRGER